MAKIYEIPEYNEAIMCPNCGEKSDVIVGLYGLFGGGEGPYTMCADCGCIVTKTCDSHMKPEVVDSTFTEVEDGQRGEAKKDQG